MSLTGSGSDTQPEKATLSNSNEISEGIFIAKRPIVGGIGEVVASHEVE